MLGHKLSCPKGGLLLSVLMLKDAGRNCYPVPGVDQVVSHESWHLADNRQKAVKYCFPAPMERRAPMRSLRSLAATPRPCATSSISSTGEAFKQLLEGAPAAHTPRLIRPSMKTKLRLLGRCCTRVPGSSARIALCGPWRWLPKRVLRRTLPKGGSAGRPSGRH